MVSVPELVQAAVIDVYLVGGQSNADGKGVGSQLPTAPVDLLVPQTDVQFYYNGLYYTGPVGLGPLRAVTSSGAKDSYFGPEITFGRSMANYHGAADEKVAIIKYAVGGSNLSSHWKAGGTADNTDDGSVYKNFQKTVSAGLFALEAANPGDRVVIKGMVWMQGEQDATVQNEADAYAANLTSFINDVRLTYGANLPFVIGRLSDGQTGLAYQDTVQAAQDSVAAAMANTGLVNTNSILLNSDHLHFGSQGQQDLGYALATSMQGLVAVLEPSSVALLGGGLALLILKCRLFF